MNKAHSVHLDQILVLIDLPHRRILLRRKNYKSIAISENFKLEIFTDNILFKYLAWDWQLRVAVYSSFDISSYHCATGAKSNSYIFIDFFYTNRKHQVAWYLFATQRQITVPSKQQLYTCITESMNFMNPKAQGCNGQAQQGCCY